MRQTSISVTEAAGNFAQCVDRVRYQNVSFVLLKNGSPVARLVPTEEKPCTGADLATALASVTLTRAEAAAWSAICQRPASPSANPHRKWE